MARVYLLLGGNLGNKLGNLETAASLIEKQIGHIVLKSSFYESEAWGFESKDKFLNQVVLIDTTYTPMQVLSEIHTIEHKLGRKRSNNGYASRLIDIDILFYNNEIIETEQLTIPHKLMHERMFTLEPLEEIAGQYVHPVKQLTVKQMRQLCNDKVKVKMVSN